MWMKRLMRVLGRMDWERRVDTLALGPVGGGLLLCQLGSLYNRVTYGYPHLPSPVVVLLALLLIAHSPALAPRSRPVWNQYSPVIGKSGRTTAHYHLPGFRQLSYPSPRRLYPSLHPPDPAVVEVQVPLIHHTQIRHLS
jgi:hypothetical protein